MDQDLLNDLEELGEDEFEEDIEEEEQEENQEFANPEDNLMESLLKQNNSLKTTSIASMTKTFHSKAFSDILDKIQVFLREERNEFYNSGPVEQDPEYELIVEANTITVELIHEISMVSKVYSIMAND